MILGDIERSNQGYCVFIVLNIIVMYYETVELSGRKASCLCIKLLQNDIAHQSRDGFDLIAQRSFSGLDYFPNI